MGASLRRSFAVAAGERSQAEAGPSAPRHGPSGEPAQAPAPMIRSKKHRSGAAAADGAAAAAAGAAQQGYVRLSGPLARTSERVAAQWAPVTLSSEDKAPAVTLDDAQLRASSSLGYRMARATHGASAGTWYYEVTVDALGKSGAARLGWAQRDADVQAPVGASPYCYAYRSLEGSKVHNGLREPYGEAYGEGDVIGCLIHLPAGPAGRQGDASGIVRYKGKLFAVEESAAGPPGPGADAPEARPALPGSFVAFSRNGVPQGKAYVDLAQGAFYPAVSLYTYPTQQAPAAVTVNFGKEGFKHAPPAVEGCPPPRPVAELGAARHGAQC